MRGRVAVFILASLLAVSACRPAYERTPPYTDLEKVDNQRIEWLKQYCGKPPYKPRQDVDAEICLNAQERKQTRADYNY